MKDISYKMEEGLSKVESIKNTTTKAEEWLHLAKIILDKHSYMMGKY